MIAPCTPDLYSKKGWAINIFAPCVFGNCFCFWLLGRLFGLIFIAFAVLTWPMTICAFKWSESCCWRLETLESKVVWTVGRVCWHACSLWHFIANKIWNIQELCGKQTSLDTVTCLKSIDLCSCLSSHCQSTHSCKRKNTHTQTNTHTYTHSRWFFRVELWDFHGLSSCVAV